MQQKFMEVTMNEIEKINRYIARTNMKLAITSPYHMNLKELLGLSGIAGEDVGRAICMAFEYGRAKGYRAAKAEGRARA